MIRAIVFDYYGVVRPSGFRLPGRRNDAALLEYIAQLRQQYKTGLLSNIESSQRFSELFESHKPEDYFDTILASGDTDYVKPDPQIYRLMAESLGVLPEQCIMVDDSADYNEGVLQAGMQPLHYIGLRQLQANLSRLTNPK